MAGEKLSSIKKATLLLEALSEPPYLFKAAELSEKLQINRTTIHRMLDDLIDSNLVMKEEEEKAYRLGPGLYRMGSVYYKQLQFNNKLTAVLSKISEESRESVGLAIRDHERIISLYELEINQPMKMNYQPGLFYPMNRGCYGKCLMAYYDQDRVEELLDQQTFEKVCKNTLTERDEILKEYEKIRKQGYVVSDEETFPYAVGVGIPIFNEEGEVKVCVAISYLKQKDHEERIEELKDILFKYAEEIRRYSP